MPRHDHRHRILHTQGVLGAQRVHPDKEINNLFEIIGIGIEHGELYIYNRDGLLIYNTANYLDGWDGRDYNGLPCVQGNYV
ncbi:MAG: gliding motility-associated C-terminal domain-containing protein [Bacteroidales bacterium]|nr:gliding motility-associated C-terminal domain-containing protein [Bacteroidales bacterium]